jgi:hypothetical protein
MLTRILFILCAALVTEHLFAQCNNCDSIIKSKGYHLITDEEKKDNPGWEDKVPTIRCTPDCGIEIEKPMRPLFVFDGRWGYISLNTGLNFDKMQMKGMDVQGFRFNQTKQYYVSVCFDLDAPEWSGIVARIETAWKPQNFEGTEETAGKVLTRWQIKAYRISKEVSLLYKSTKGKVRWLVGIGLGRDRAITQTNTKTYYNTETPQVVQSNVDIDRSNWFTALSAGIMYRNRFELRYKRIGTQWGDAGTKNVRNISNVIAVGCRLW